MNKTPIQSVKWLVALSVLLCATVSCLAQQAPPITTSQLTIPANAVSPSPPATVNVTRIGTPGPNLYYYWVVADLPIGWSTPSAAALVSSSNGTLDTNNYNRVTWSIVTGATSYQVLRTTTSTQPAPGCTCATTGGTVTATSFNDQSNTLGVYSNSPWSGDTSFNVTNKVVGAGESQLTFAADHGSVFAIDSITGAVLPAPTLNNATLTGTTTVKGPFQASGGGEFAGTWPNAGTITGGAVNPATLNQTLYAKGSDIGAEVNAANAACAAYATTGCEIVIPAGAYSFSTPIIITTRALLVGQGGGTVLTYTGTGTAITLDIPSEATNLQDSHKGMQGIMLLGPSAAGATVGVLIEGPSAGSSATGVQLNGVTIRGFGTGVEIGSNAYWTRLQDTSLEFNGVNFSFPSGTTNSGEQISFEHSFIADATVGANIDIDAGGASIQITDTSVDCGSPALNVGSDAASAYIDISGSHFECHSLAQAISAAAGIISVVNSTFLQGASTGTLASLIAVSGTTSIYVQQSGFQTLGATVTDLIANTGTGDVVYGANNTDAANFTNILSAPANASGTWFGTQILGESGVGGNSAFNGIRTGIQALPSGTINTSGTGVTWVSGDHFDPFGGWDGLTITIGGTAYTISSVASATSLTLTASAGTQTGAAFITSTAMRQCEQWESYGATVTPYVCQAPASDNNVAFLGSGRTDIARWDATGFTTAAPLTISDGATLASGKTLSGGTVNATTLEQGSQAVALKGVNGISAGTVTLVAGAGSHTFTTAYASAPVCTASDTTAPNAVQVTSSTTAVTLAGTTTDVVAWQCSAAVN